MKRITLSLILLILLSAVIITAFSSCDVLNEFISTSPEGNETEESAAKNKCIHKIITIPEIAPTCTEAGKTEKQYCELCGTTIVESVEIPATGHTVLTEEGIAPTCTEAGKTEKQYCELCGTTIVESVEIPATGHTVFEDVAVKPTCEKSGFTGGSHCSVCGETFVECEYIRELGHTIVEQPLVKPTCTKDGMKAGEYCSVCGAVIIKQTVLPAKGHKLVTVSAVSPTCTEDGKTASEYCSVCGEVTKEASVIKATGHAVVTVTQVNPTCQSTGTTESRYCSNCGLVIASGTTIAKLEHQWSEWKENEVYEETRTCSLCGYSEVKKQKYNPANHTPIETYNGYTDKVNAFIQQYHSAVNNWDGYSTITLKYNNFSREEIGQFVGYLNLYYGFWDFEDFIDLHVYTTHIEIRAPKGYTTIENNRELLIKEVDRILLTFNEGNDFEILQQIADYLADTIAFTQGYNGAGCALFEHKAVCNGYTIAFKWLAERAGIECDYIYGLAVRGGGNHAWNEVYIDGEIYYYDVTWYDASAKDAQYIVSTSPIHIVIKINAFEVYNK